MDGFVTLKSANDFATTLGRLTDALKAKGVTIFAIVDHAAGAAHAGMSLRPTTLVIFGNPAVGTPLMQAAQTVGIDLPLRALIWEDANGATHLSYNDPSWIAERYGAQNLPAVAALTTALNAVALHAAAPLTSP